MKTYHIVEYPISEIGKIPFFPKWVTRYTEHQGKEICSLETVVRACNENNEQYQFYVTSSVSYDKQFDESNFLKEDNLKSFVSECYTIAMTKFNNQIKTSKKIKTFVLDNCQYPESSLYTNRYNKQILKSELDHWSFEGSVQDPNYVHPYFSKTW